MISKAWYAKYHKTKITKLQDKMDAFLQQKTFEATLKTCAYQPVIQKHLTNITQRQATAEKQDEILTILKETNEGTIEKLEEMTAAQTSTSGTPHLTDSFTIKPVKQYIKRETEIKKVESLLQKQGLCIIHGFGGTGKTTRA